jgi:hypothetical protein
VHSLGYSPRHLELVVALTLFGRCAPLVPECASLPAIRDGVGVNASTAPPTMRQWRGD